jgi:hypothetical protein
LCPQQFRPDDGDGRDTGRHRRSIDELRGSPDDHQQHDECLADQQQQTRDVAGAREFTQQVDREHQEQDADHRPRGEIANTNGNGAIREHQRTSS